MLWRYAFDREIFGFLVIRAEHKRSMALARLFANDANSDMSIVYVSLSILYRVAWIGDRLVFTTNNDNDYNNNNLIIIHTYQVVIYYYYLLVITFKSMTICWNNPPRALQSLPTPLPSIVWAVIHAHTH